jgi:hypothetical protein
MERAKATAWGLTLAGLVPFIGCGIMASFGGPFGVDWTAALIGYAAVILSFLGGARWGRELTLERPDPLRLVLSNAPAVWAWLALVLNAVSPPGRLSMLAIGLLLVWTQDRRTASPWYAALRTTATLGAVLSLAVAGLALR